MCPDKPPSCYPTPTLGESGFERFDRHPWNQSASGVQIVSDREHVFAATGRQELRGPHVVAKGTCPSSARHRVHGRERQLADRGAAGDPSEGPGQAEARQTADGEPACRRARRSAATGVHHRRGGREPARAGPRDHDTDAQELPPARQEQDREASEERGADRVRPARQQDAQCGEARGADRARALPNSDAASRQSRRRARRRRARRRRLRRFEAARERFS
jgi:hypothetical protein